MEIQKEDVAGIYSDDAVTVQADIADGVGIVPAKELPDNFPPRYRAWIDTPENREPIANFSK